jgi:hypothetical protein
VSLPLTARVVVLKRSAGLKNGLVTDRGIATRFADEPFRRTASRSSNGEEQPAFCTIVFHDSGMGFVALCQ